MAIFDQPEKRPARGPLVLLLAMIGAGLLVWRSTQAPPPARPTVPATAPAPAPAAAEPPPPPALSDDALQSLLQAVSANPLLRAWLAQGDVVHRWAVVTGNLSEDAAPRRDLAFLKPAAPFAAAGGVITEASHQRYDAIADAIASVDAAAFAKVTRALHPALAAAYRELGYPDPLDAAAADALLRLERLAVPEGPVRVEQKGALWIFASPSLEALGPVEKQLLRMGPRNQRLVQSKARELRAALGLEAAAKAR